MLFVINSAPDLSERLKGYFSSSYYMLVYSSRLFLEEGKNHPLLMAISDYGGVFKMANL